MRTIIFFLMMFFFVTESFAQNTSAATIIAEQLENLTAASNDETTEDDSYLQQLEQFKTNPINLNTADESMLKELHLLSALQISSLMNYRNYLGKLISVYELQALPGWDLRTINKIRPYITVRPGAENFASLKKRFRGGTNVFLLRYGQTLQRSAGYFIDPSSGKNYYTGSPQKLFVRYRYQFKNLLQYGFSADKDAGEQFFKGAQKKGFDFYSAHLFFRNIGVIKSMAIGDFSVNLGQGLIQWMSLAFAKSSEITMIKRESDILLPYNSSGEIVFHRGAGITLKKGKYEATVFGSYRKLDANFIPSDSVMFENGHVSSLQTSGYHRTPGEIADKGIQRQLCFGGNISYHAKGVQAGINAVQYLFRYPIQKKNEPYNLYAFSGNSLMNYSVDYAYTFRNMHFFGEAAFSQNRSPASVNGLLISVSGKADISVIYRNVSKSYSSLYSNAFTESSSVSNEKGIFAGISLKPSDQWRIDAFTDHWRSPWLRYRINAPSTGSDYFLKLSWRPDKKADLQMQYKCGKSQINDNSEDFTLQPVRVRTSNSLRLSVSHKIRSDLQWRSRAEALWLVNADGKKESGSMIYTEVLYNPLTKPYSGNLRLQCFETDSYNSRLYAYEDDVLYAYSVPVLYGKGYKFYLNFNYLIKKYLSLAVKISHVLYPDRISTGTYLDKLSGNGKSELKGQLILKF